MKSGFVLTLGTLSATSAVAIDICLPAQPEIARALGEAPSAGAALVSAYLWGFAASHFIWGPAADRFGRIWPLRIALVGFLVAAVICALAPDMTTLLWARVLSGLFGGGASIIARAIARDQGGGPVSAQLLAFMAIMLGVAPLLAPPIGSGLFALFGWRSTFWFLVFFGLLAIAGTAVFLSRNPATAQIAPSGEFLRRLVPILGKPDFLLGVFLASVTGIGFPALLAVGAEVAEEHYGIGGELFGLLFMIPAAAFILGSVAAQRTVRRLHRDTLIFIGVTLGAVAGIALIFGHSSPMPLWALWALVSLYSFGYGILFPATMSKALEPAGAAAGSASSLLGLATCTAAAVGAQLAASHIFSSSYVALCLLIAGPMLLSWVVLVASTLALRRRTG